MVAPTYHKWVYHIIGVYILLRSDWDPDFVCLNAFVVWSQCAGIPLSLDAVF